jgi:hypothetical protein
MHWILQNNIWKEEGRYELEEALGQLRIPYSIHRLDARDQLVPAPHVREKHVIAMGSYALRKAAAEHGWNPGIFDLEGRDFVLQRQHWGCHLLNHDARQQAFRDVQFREARELFIRPIGDSKVFNGAVYTKLDFLRWRADIYANPGDGLTRVSLDTPVLTCSPKQILAEYRYWIVAGRIATRSLYRRGGRLISSPEVDPRIDIFAVARAKEWQPHEAFVLDVCETPEGLRIVEINTVNRAGIYAGNVWNLVTAVEALRPN